MRSDRVVVPGLDDNHSYGVLKFDAATVDVTFWNSFGNRDTPKGEPGLKNGFATDDGRLTMKLTDAVLWFDSYSIEIDIVAMTPGGIEK